jgi:hypothetical protein
MNRPPQLEIVLAGVDVDALRVEVDVQILRNLKRLQVSPHQGSRSSTAVD